MAVPVRGSTRPSFLLTNSVQLPVTTVTGGYVKGRWQEVVTGSREIKANVQPLKDHEIMLMPESERTRDWIKVYTTDTLETSFEGELNSPAEYVTWNGFTYRVMSKRKYQMGVLDHERAYCAREPISALEIE